MAMPQCLPPLVGARPPRTRLPDGTIDTHCHVYADPQAYPWSAARSYDPAPASLDAYLAVCAAIGVARTVQVNASVYGFDNSLTLDIIRRLGRHRARGIAGVSPDIADAELDRLNEGGFCGARLSTAMGGYGGAEAIEALAARVGRAGWHLQLHFRTIQEVADLEPLLMRVPVPLVFDHMGGIHGRDGVGAAGFAALLRLLTEREDCWTKLSSWYRRSASPAPAHADMQPIVQALVAARPERLLFGTNWPHPSLFPPASVPDDGDLADNFAAWIPDERIRARICVENPERLYGFAS